MEARLPTEEPRITVGERVVWLSHDTGKPEHGTVRWTGVLETINQSELSVGVELDHPVGLGDGKWGDMELFTAKPQHGIIIPAMGLIREDVFQEPLYMSSSVRARDPPLNVGDRVVWLENVEPQHATVRWVGVLSELGSDWTVGIEFDKQVGKMDGMWNKSRLFDCKKGHGMVVNAMGLIREDVFTGSVDEPSIVILSESTNGHGDNEGEAGQEDPNNDQNVDSNQKLDHDECSGDEYLGDDDDDDDGDREQCDREDAAPVSDMDSLSINRLLRKLEAAICRGRRKEAATLARELAHLKINCTMKRLRLAKDANPRDMPIILNLYVEDRVSHHGPIPIQAFPRMTVGELKSKMFQDFEFPPNVQRWILGRSLITDDDVTLDSKGVDRDGCPIYLYLVSLDECAVSSNAPSSTFYVESHTYENVAASGNRDSDVGAATNGAEAEEELGWRCEVCTLINIPTRPGCEACSANRPEYYVVPQKSHGTKNPTHVWEEEDVASAEGEACGREEQEKMCGYRRLMELEDLDVIASTEPIECPVCFSKIEVGQGIKLRDCLHSFCTECIRNAVQYSDEAVVRCPYRDDEYSCPSILQEREIRALVSAEVFERHLRKGMVAAENQTPNSFHCRTPNCPGWCEYEDTVNLFPCPVCEAVNCLTCQAIHEGQDCRLYQETLEMDAANGDDAEAQKTIELLEVMLQKGEAIRCAKCRVILMKKWGCDWVRCSVCQTEICWVTRGPRWGPNGKGDLTGGCKCGVGGKKCHPLCNYCH